MPPPAHTEHTIIINSSGECSAEYIPDYPSQNVPVWKESFEAPIAKLESLYRLMVEKGIFSRKFREVKAKDRRIGGSYAWIEATANNKTVRLGTHLVDDDREAAQVIYDEIRKIAPDAVWDIFSKKRENYKKEVYNR
jgi:hypothetical protein